MTSATKIRELVEALLANGGHASETQHRLDVRGQLDQAGIQGWADVQASLPILGVTSLDAIDSLGELVDFAAASSSLIGDELRIQVHKVHGSTTAFCLTPDGVAAVFSDLEVSSHIKQVWVACNFDPVVTESCRIDPWTCDSAEVPESDDDVRAPDPRRLVKDFIGGRVPKSVFPYILTSDVGTPSQVYEKWRELAVVRLLHSLVNEIFAADGEKLVVTGTRPRTVDGMLKAPYSDRLFKAVTEAARWVYASGRDVDTRFALFTYEISREWPDALTAQEGFAERGEHALEAAKTAFRAHVQETSKDTLKSLGDLRKTLSEEVTKVVSQTRDLLGTMWKDFMIAATAFLGRVVLLGTDKPLVNPAPLQALLIGTAIFLFFSLCLSLRANAKFMEISEMSRAEWRKKLYGFMNDEDFEKLSDLPLKESTRTYKHMTCWVIVAYVVVIGCLILEAGRLEPAPISGKAASATLRPLAGDGSTPNAPDRSSAPSLGTQVPQSAKVQPASAPNAVAPHASRGVAVEANSP